MSSNKRQKTTDNRTTPDPFCSHFENNDLEELLNASDFKLTTKLAELTELGKCKYEFNENVINNLNQQHTQLDNLENLKPDDLHLKERILDKLDDLSTFTKLQKSLLNVICSYKDLHFNECTNENREQIMQVYCVHALNHVLKTRARVINNNQRLKKEPDLEFKDQGFTRPKVLIILPFRSSAYQVINYLVQLFSGTRQLNYFDKEFEKSNKKGGKKADKKGGKKLEEEEEEEEEEELEEEDEEDDQLDDEYLLEDKEDEELDDDKIDQDNQADQTDLVKETKSETNLTQTTQEENSGQKVTIMNLKKFKKEFHGEYHVASKKPDDYKQMFNANTSEYFRIGIEFTKKSLKLYSRFYSSDIIVASPLGLRTILGAEGEKKRDYDFLSSIELLIMDQTELFLMQNWEHVLHLMKNMNLQPKDHHNTDFSRIRLWSLDGLSKFYRQTLMFSSIKSIYLASLFAKETFNFEGRLHQFNFKAKLPAANAILHKQILLKTVEHRFQRFSTSGSLSNSADARFKFFTETVLPQLNSSELGKTLIYVPSYFDFVRLRNFMRNGQMSFTQVSEHTDVKKAAGSRKRFFTNNRKFLLYTERAHFYYRFTMKGICHLVFYQLPTFPHFYTELSSMLIETNQRKDFVDDGKTFKCTAIYDQYDKLLLLQTLGNQKTNELISSFHSLSTL